MTTTLRKFATYEEAIAYHSIRNLEDIVAVRDALFSLLRTAGIETVTVKFDGYGDSGQIEDIDVTGQITELPGEPIETPHTTIEFECDDEAARRTVKSYNIVTTFQVQSPRPLLEALCFELLAIKHDGWENSEGAYGDLTFETDSATITVDFNERFVDSTNSNYDV